MAKVLLIKDGYTYEGRVPARGITAAFTFKYRPALPERVYEFLTAMRVQDGKTQMAEVAKLLEEHLVAWDIDHPVTPGEKAPITREILYMVPQFPLSVMADKVCGYTEAEASLDRKN